MMNFFFFFCRRRLFSFHFSRLRSLHLHRCLVEFEHGSFVRWAVLILSFPLFLPFFISHSSRRLSQLVK